MDVIMVYTCYKDHFVVPTCHLYQLASSLNQLQVGIIAFNGLLVLLEANRSFSQYVLSSLRILFFNSVQELKKQKE